MLIRNDVVELQTIRQEIKRHLGEIKKFREKEKFLCKKISAYLIANDLPGVKFEGMAILNEEKEKRKLKPKKEAFASTIDVLKQYVANPEKVLEEIAEAKKGDVTVESSIKIQRPKTKKR